ncbi:MAG: TIGR03085 family protein [Catenulispora sp.]|nr:TIGR03085 family protein [Catenulispora sp.]
MTDFAREQRAALIEALREAGPEAPTLCAGWTARDLAAHVVTRERRADAAAGIVVKALAPRLARVQGEFAALPWDELLALVVAGPPRRSLFALPGVDELANFVEFFVHCEDVRRAGPGWEPRVLAPPVSEALWRRLSAMSRMVRRHCPAPLVVRRLDGQSVVVRKGSSPVTVVGEPGELVLFLSGRQGHSVVQTEGPEEAVVAVRGAKFGV